MVPLSFLSGLCFKYLGHLDDFEEFLCWESEESEGDRASEGFNIPGQVISLMCSLQHGLYYL